MTKPWNYMKRKWSPSSPTSYPKYKREQKLCAKLSDKQVEEIRRLYGVFPYAYKIAELYSVNYKTINRLCVPKWAEEQKERSRLLWQQRKNDPEYRKKMLEAVRKSEKRKMKLMPEARKYKNQRDKFAPYKNSKKYFEMRRKNWKKNYDLNKEYRREYARKYYRRQKLATSHTMAKHEKERGD